jgi:hypothetical protein
MANQAATPPWNARRWGSRWCLAWALGSLLFGTVELASWHLDRALLQSVATDVAGRGHDEVERLTRLTDWVYRNQGFVKNRRYHLWPKLGATPVQVLEQGGDCEDKSRLLVALLRELGVKSSLAMLSPCPQCRPTHTVALVETRAGWTLVDAVYNITFPDGRGGLRTIETLRAERALLERRLAELRAARGPADKINRYRVTGHYAHLTTINWRKNALTRGVAGLIRATGAEPWSVSRPLFLDDPKQLFASLGLGGALGFCLLALLLHPHGYPGRLRLNPPDRSAREARAGSLDLPASRDDARSLRPASGGGPCPARTRSSR